MRIRSLDAADGTVLATASQTESGTLANSRASNDRATAPAAGELTDNAGQPRSASAAARTRDERYQALLRSAPPSGTASQQNEAPIAPVTNPAPPPTLVERAVKPIASINRPPQPPQPMASRQPQGDGSQNSRRETPKDPEEKRDEDSDVTPPRLVGAEFVPPQVQDGEQTTFFAMVTDDISGVRSVSGVVVSPSGAQQGFACQREAAGEGGTGRFFARITVPKDAAEGQWIVKYLSLADNAGNTINLNSAQGALPGSASFRVQSSGSDSKGPVLKAVWLDQASMGAGEKNQVTVQAEDDKSGVNLVSGVFVSPSKQARIGFGCRSAGGDTWQCPVTPPTCVDCGSWQLEQVQLQDKANNMTTVRTDNPIVGNVRLELYGKQCDNTPPVITSLAVDPPNVSNAQGGIIRVTAVATDDQCGIATLSGVAMPPANAGNTRIYFPFKQVGEGDTYVGEIVVPQHAPSGTWTIGWIQALDKGHNLKAYSSSDPVVARVSFRVE